MYINVPTKVCWCIRACLCPNLRFYAIPVLHFKFPITCIKKAVACVFSWVSLSQDPSLTPDNILQSTRNIPLWNRNDSYHFLNMPFSLHNGITTKYSGEQAKRELVSTWLASYPYPTWEHVADLLKSLENRGKGMKGAAEKVEETYLKCELQWNILGDKKTFLLFTARSILFPFYSWWVYGYFTKQEMLRSRCGMSTENVESEIIRVQLTHGSYYYSIY